MSKVKNAKVLSDVKAKKAAAAQIDKARKSITKHSATVKGLLSKRSELNKKLGEAQKEADKAVKSLRSLRKPKAVKKAKKPVGADCGSSSSAVHQSDGCDD